MKAQSNNRSKNLIVHLYSFNNIGNATTQVAVELLTPNRASQNNTSIMELLGATVTPHVLQYTVLVTDTIKNNIFY